MCFNNKFKKSEKSTLHLFWLNDYIFFNCYCGVESLRTSIINQLLTTIKYIIHIWPDGHSSKRLITWGFSARDELSSQASYIDKKFQLGLKIYKRMRRTLVCNNKYKKQRFPPSHSVSARSEISHVIAFFFEPSQPCWNFSPGWNSPCNQPLSVHNNILS